MAKLNSIILLLYVSFMMSSCWHKPDPVAQQLRSRHQENVSKLTKPNDTISPHSAPVCKPAHVFLPTQHRTADKVGTLH
jgi:hypothetical protein